MNKQGKINPITVALSTQTLAKRFHYIFIFDKQFNSLFFKYVFIFFIKIQELKKLNLIT